MYLMYTSFGALEGQQHCRKLTDSGPFAEDSLTFPRDETLAPIQEAEGSEMSEECPEVSRDVAGSGR